MALRIYFFLGLYRVLAVLADLVRQHSRGNILVCQSAIWGLAMGFGDAGLGAFRFPVLWLDVACCEAFAAKPDVLVPCFAGNALD